MVGNVGMGTGYAVFSSRFRPPMREKPVSVARVGTELRLNRAKDGTKRSPLRSFFRFLCEEAPFHMYDADETFQETTTIVLLEDLPMEEGTVSFPSLCHFFFSWQRNGVSWTVSWVYRVVETPFLAIESR